jgi:K+-sensing histidine kinase KdpD
MSDQIQSSRASIDYELLSHIAHEARGPYNGLIGFSDLLDSNFDTLPVERQKEYAHIVKLLASKSFFQLQTVISWLKLVSSNFKVNHSPFYLSEAVKYAMQYNANDTKGKSIEMLAQTGEAGKIYGDLNYISVAVANVVSFLLVYLEKQSKIELSIVESPEKEFSVKVSVVVNNAPEELNHLLELFCNNPDQVPETKTTLWVAGQILKHHQSPIVVENDPNNQLNIRIGFRSHA